MYLSLRFVVPFIFYFDRFGFGVFGFLFVLDRVENRLFAILERHNLLKDISFSFHVKLFLSLAALRDLTY